MTEAKEQKVNINQRQEDEDKGGGSFVERATHGTLGRGREDLVRFLDPSV